MAIHPKFTEAVSAMTAPSADAAVIKDILDNQDLLPTFGVDSPLKIAHFLSQVGHESGGLKVSVEKMSYTAQRLMEVWPRRFPTLEEAQKYERNAEKLANFVYANRMGNGDTASGDGFRYRGRGLLQLTGKEMYQKAAVPAGLPLDTEPELAERAEGALQIACGVWKLKKVDELPETAPVEDYTKRINGGLIGLDDRKQRFARVRGVMGI